MRASIVALSAAVIVLACALPAFAHALGVSRGEYVVSGNVVTATMVFREDELRASTTEADIIEATRIDADGVACGKGTIESTAPDPPDGVRIVARFMCPARPTKVRIHAGFLQRLSGGHSHVATVVGPRGGRSEHLAVLAQPDIDVDLGAAPSLGFFEFVRAGVEHILTGADHLLFLLGLVLLRRDDTTTRRDRIRALVFVLTAFTLGHSVSLAIATLGGFAPSARIVEPLVALSVAYVGAENLFAKSSHMRRRWLVTLPFGLVHGFAFASGLLIVGLPRRELPAALVGFNLGVELGQLSVMALVLPLLFLLARRPRAYDVTCIALSAGVLACGVVWFVQRLL